MTALRLAWPSVLLLTACGPSPALDARPLPPPGAYLHQPAPPSVAAWVKRLGGAGADECGGVHVDAAGNVFVVGSFTGTADFGQGPIPSAGRRDAFVVKIDPGGRPVFSKRLGGADDDGATAAATDAAGNVFVAGYVTGRVDLGGGPVGREDGIRTDVFVAALGPGGEPRWSRLLGAPGSHLRPAIAVDPAGNVLVTGHFEASLGLPGKRVPSRGEDDVFVVKLSPAGEVVWGRTAGGTGSDAGTAITVDPAGHIYVAGESDGPIDFGQGPIGSHPGHQGYVVALDGAAGAPLWGRPIGARGEGGASGVIVDAAGHVTVVGVAVERGAGAGATGRTFLAQLDPSGRELWSQSLGDAGFTQGTAVTEDSAGNVLVTGSTSAGDGSGRAAFLARFDPGGHRTGYSRLGGPAEGRTVAFDRAGQMVIGGSFGGRLPLAGGALDSAGDSDVFIARLPPNGLW